MKIRYGLATLSAVLLTGCVAARLAGPAVNWDFVQSVGGMDVGTPYIDGDLLFIPVTVDFSGNRTVTLPPTNPNTGLQCDWGQASLQTGPLLPFPVYDYDIEVQFQAVEATAPRRRRFASNTCEELMVALALPTLMGILPEPETIHLWYRDSLFIRHYIGEYAL